jgi:hypothetical protein
MSYKQKGRQKRQTSNKQAFSADKNCNNLKSSALKPFFISLLLYVAYLEKPQLRLTTKILIAR